MENWEIFFFKFKRDFINAAKQNRTVVNDQMTKVKENIKDYAKSLIPASKSKIVVVNNNKVANLMKVEAWPQDGNKDCYRRQVKGVLRVRVLPQDIIDSTNTVQSLADVIYKKENLANFLRLFPTFMVDKLARVEEKYRNILVKLEELIYGSTSLQVPGQVKAPTKPEPPPPLHLVI